MWKERCGSSEQSDHHGGKTVLTIPEVRRSKCHESKSTKALRRLQTLDSPRRNSAQAQSATGPRRSWRSTGRDTSVSSSWLRLGPGLSNPDSLLLNRPPDLILYF